MNTGKVLNIADAPVTTRTQIVRRMEVIATRIKSIKDEYAALRVEEDNLRDENARLKSAEETLRTYIDKK